MPGLYLATLVAFSSVLASVYGLKCHEGIDMTVSGLPIYYWGQRECADDSKCIRQAITFSTNMAGINFDSSMQYGACMSRAYSDYLDCENLFGKGSTFDPVNLLDMIPGVETSISNALQQTYLDAANSLKNFLSNGTGIASFIDGAFIFYENLGFNLKKAVPLKPSLVKLMSTSMGGSPLAVDRAFREFLNDFAQLDTANAEFAGAINSLLSNVGVDLSTMPSLAPMATTLIERGPGLLRSTFPRSWQMELWYDVAFKIVGNIDPKNWTKSTEDMVATIRSSYQIPSNVSQYTDPILDALPDLARGSAVNPTYVGGWSLELLKKFSETDGATEKLYVALVNFIQKLIGATPQQEFLTTIQWMPGLFYQFFPKDKAIIQEVYTKMANALDTYHPGSADPSSAAETKLSKMIVNLVPKFGQIELPTAYKGLVVSLSHMFYELMKVNSVDYTKYIDDFSTVIDDGFKDINDYNVGTIIENLIVKMGGEVPAELRPMLSSIQPIITVATTQPTNVLKVLSTLKDIATNYKSSYPNSPFPALGERLVDTVFKFMTSTSLKAINDANMELQYWNIDLQFAIIKTYGIESDELYRMAAEAWPEYHLLIRVMKAMNPEDVKQMIKDITKYLTQLSPQKPFTTKGLMEAMKPSMAKITGSIKSLMGEMRQWFAPDSCKFLSCDDQDLCNTRLLITSQKAFRRDPAATLAPLTTSSSNRVISTSVLLNIATLWITSKMFK